MEFTAPPPGTAGIGEIVPAGVRRSSATRPMSALTSVLDASPAWGAEARATVSWASTVVGWVIAAVAGIAVFAALNPPTGIFGWLMTFGNHSWIVIASGALSMLGILATATPSRGLRTFNDAWLNVYMASCALGIFASVGLVAAVVAAVVFAVLAFVVGVMLVIGLIVAALDS